MDDLHLIADGAKIVTTDDGTEILVFWKALRCVSIWSVDGCLQCECVEPPRQDPWGLPVRVEIDDLQAACEWLEAAPCEYSWTVRENKA